MGSEGTLKNAQLFEASASNRSEYQEYFLGDKGGRCVGLSNLLPYCPDCLEN